MENTGVRKVRILLIEDNPADVDLLRRDSPRRTSTVN